LTTPFPRRRGCSRSGIRPSSLDTAAIGPACCRPVTIQLLLWLWLLLPQGVVLVMALICETKRQYRETVSTTPQNLYRKVRHYSRESIQLRYVLCDFRLILIGHCSCGIIH
jgi:hypothetical protein